MLITMNTQFSYRGESCETIKTFEVAISPLDAAIRTDMHMNMETIGKLIATFLAKELGFSSMHFKNMFFKVRVHLKAETTERTEALDKLRVVTRHVFLKIMFSCEAHTT